MTRLNINIKEGTLEVEGEESFVAGVYADFKEQLALGTAVARSIPPSAASLTTVATSEVKQAKKSRNSKTKESLTILKDLDLSEKTNPQSLRTFYEAKNPGNTMEQNAVYVYYLQMIAGIDNITPDHIYSCYKNIGIKVPAIRQSLMNTAFHKGYVDTSSLDAIKLATPGENFVEQDLPKAEK